MIPDSPEPVVPQFVYLIGEPGIGKTTLLARLIGASVDRREPVTDPIPHIRLNNGAGAVVGAERGVFSGTDTLPLNVQPRAVEWVRSAPYPLMFAEGDRLANDGFFEAVCLAGYALNVVVLKGSRLAATRRAERAAKVGKVQNPTWVQGRITKTDRLAARWATRVFALEGPNAEEFAYDVLYHASAFEMLREARGCSGS